MNINVNDITFAAPDGSAQVPAPSDDPLFINYTHPAHLLDSRRRKLVTSFVATAHKRRSRQIKRQRRGRLEWNRSESAPDPQIQRLDDAELQTSEYASLELSDYAALPTSDDPELVDSSGDTEVEGSDDSAPLQPVVQRPQPPSQGRRLPGRPQLGLQGGPRTDPFGIYPIRANCRVVQAIDFYVQVWAPPQVPLPITLAVGNPLISELLPLALQNTGLFGAIVAMSQTYQAMLYGLETKPTKEVLHYCGVAMTEVRKKLMSPSWNADDTAIMTVMMLIGIDYLLGNTQSYGVHLKGIHHMVELRGGLDKLGQHGITKMLILQIDNFWTLMSGENSTYFETRVIEKLKYPSHGYSHSQSPQLRTIIATIPVGFRELATEGKLSVQMLRTIEGMSTFVMHADALRENIATPEQTYPLLVHEPHSIIHDTNAFLDSWNLGGGSEIEPCLCFALIASRWNAPALGQAHGPVYRQLVGNLVDALEVFEADPVEAQCFVWMSMVAVGHSRGIPSLARRGNRIMDFMLENHDHTRDWKQLQIVLRKFFWYEPFANQWELCWRDGMHRRHIGERPRSITPKAASQAGVRKKYRLTG